MVWICLKVNVGRVCFHDLQALFELSKKLGVTIVPSDIPDLYAHDANPAQKFLRRVIFAYTNLEKDMTVHRLQTGLKTKKEAAMRAQKAGAEVRRNQSGRVKVNGRKSWLEKLGGKVTKSVLKDMKAWAKKYRKAIIGLRPLAAKFSKLLKLQKPMAHETARRIQKLWR